MAKKMLVSGNKLALVDDDDYEYFNQWNWQCNGEGYATRHVRTKVGRVCIVMHREIMKAKSGEYVDHINRDTLDNRKENLRICTNIQNSRNRGKQANNTSGYKGVSYYKSTGKWKAQITINGKKKAIGYFNTPEDAALAYDKVAKENFTCFAFLNFGEV